MEGDDSPMQVETIDDPTVSHLTLKNLDRHSHYRFYLRGRTAAGDGEPIMKKGATTLDGGMKQVSSASQICHVEDQPTLDQESDSSLSMCCSASCQHQPVCGGNFS